MNVHLGTLSHGRLIKLRIRIRVGTAGARAMVAEVASGDLAEERLDVVESFLEERSGAAHHDVAMGAADGVDVPVVEQGLEPF